MNHPVTNQVRRIPSVIAPATAFGLYVARNVAMASMLIVTVAMPSWAGLCDAILEKGVFGRSFRTSTVSLGEDYLSVACDKHFTSQQEATKWSGSVGLADVLKVVFGLDTSKWKQTYDEVCRSTALRRTFYERIQEELIFADPVLVQGWVECLRLNSTGVRSWIEAPGDTQFTFHVEYLACHPKAPQTAQVVDFSVSGGSCVNPLKKGSKITSAGMVLQCQRATPDSDVTVVLNSNAGPATARLMAPEPLDHIFPGSWINANFDIWIGAEEDNQAWSQLLRARATYDATTGVPAARYSPKAARLS